jgi:hypothetical protein
MEISFIEDFEKLKGFLGVFAETVKAAAKEIAQFFRENWKMIKEKTIELLAAKEGMKIARRNHCKIDFRPFRIRNQVIERKPRHLIRKVIH